MQLAFFPNGDARVVNEVQVYLSLTATVNSSDICGPGDFYYYADQPTFYWDGSWGNIYTWRGGSSLAVIASDVLLTATMYEGIIWLAYVYCGAVYQQDTNVGDYYVDLTLDLGTNLSCNPDSKSTEYVALHLLSWVGTQRSGERGHTSKLDCSNCQLPWHKFSSAYKYQEHIRGRVWGESRSSPYALSIHTSFQVHMNELG